MQAHVIQQLLATAIEEDRKAQAQLDSIVLIGGASALLASITFLNYIAKTPARWTLGVLTAAWLLILGGCLCAMVALLRTRHASRILQNTLSTMLVESRERMSPTEEAAFDQAHKRTRSLSGQSLGLFGGGIVLLVTFAVANLPWRTAQGVTSTLSSGTPMHRPNPQSPPTPPKDDPFKRGYDFNVPPTIRPEPPQPTPQPPKSEPNK